MRTLFWKAPDDVAAAGGLTSELWSTSLQRFSQLTGDRISGFPSTRTCTPDVDWRSRSHGFPRLHRGLPLVGLRGSRLAIGHHWPRLRGFDPLGARAAPFDRSDAPPPRLRLVLSAPGAEREVRAPRGADASILSWDSSSKSPPPFSRGRPLPEHAPRRALLRRVAATPPARSVPVVFHHLDGFLRPRVPSVLQPGPGPGVHGVSPDDLVTLPKEGSEAGRFPVRAFVPFEGFPSSAAVPHHCGRCPPAVRHPLRCRRWLRSVPIDRSGSDGPRVGERTSSRPPLASREARGTGSASTGAGM
jgi:hypothetical protein